MTIQAWVIGATGQLIDSSTTPRLDAELLLCTMLNKNRAWIHAHPDNQLSIKELRKLNAQLKRRATGEPIAYIFGSQEFYGRIFIVNKHVLVPRPESEALIDLAKEYSNPNSLIADVGAGSGALGITLALESKANGVHFYDIDQKALRVAKGNARTHGVKGQYYTSNLLENNYGPYDIILANLPYVPDAYPINCGARHEPTIALFGGETGLELYEILFKQLALQSPLPKAVVTESLPFQHSDLARLARENGFILQKTSGLAQLFCPF